MDLQNGLPTVSEESKKEEIVKALSTCCLCGTTLEFTHVTHHVNQMVQEAAKCPSCGIQTKVNSFILQ